jgi:acyl carrier protein
MNDRCLTAHPHNLLGGHNHMADLHDEVQRYILDEFLPGEDPALLTESTPLVTGGILDSIATMKLATFLEDRFKIRLEAHEMSVDHLNTVADIVALVRAKQSR